MCTVTLVPILPKARRNLDSELRIAFNRDESRKRAPARPPEIRKCGERMAIMPIDQPSDGSWIAVNDAGIAACLLNQYRFEQQARTPNIGTRSRGEIVPLAMECMTIEDALDRVRAHVREIATFSPFTLILASLGTLLEYRSTDVGQGQAARLEINEPKMFTSSGLGDALVYAPRKQLFDQMFAAPENLIESQDAFHRHQWRDHPELSVCMSRPEARTVSYTVLEMNIRSVALTYYPAPPNEPSEPARMALNLRARP